MQKISKPHLSNKHQIIDKNNSQMLIAVAASVFIVFFSLFVMRALFSQASYQQKVIDGKKDALKVAKQNIVNAEDLRTTYEAFSTEAINVLGGNPTGVGPLDGSNPKIVLDSLPSAYDYPALSSSIEKLFLDNGYAIGNIGGTEDPSLAGSTPSKDKDKASSATKAKTKLVEIPYPISASSDVEGSKKLLEILERSIRPFYVEKLSISGSGSRLESKITMKTYYFPETGVSVTTKVIK